MSAGHLQMLRLLPSQTLHDCCRMAELTAIGLLNPISASLYGIDRYGKNCEITLRVAHTRNTMELTLQVKHDRNKVVFLRELK